MMIAKMEMTMLEGGVLALGCELVMGLKREGGREGAHHDQALPTLTMGFILAVEL